MRSHDVPPDSITQRPSEPPPAWPDDDAPPRPQAPGPGGQDDLSGAFALVLLASLGLFIWLSPPSPRFSREAPLYELFIWGVVLALALGVALTSVRHGPPGQRLAGWLALVISLLGVFYVAALLASAH